MRDTQHLKIFWIKNDIRCNLNVCNFQRVMFVARKADAITLVFYTYFWKDFPIHTDANTWSHYLGEYQLNFVWYLMKHSILRISVTITQVMKFILFTTAIFTKICRCRSWRRCSYMKLFWLCPWSNCSYL